MKFKKIVQDIGSRTLNFQTFSCLPACTTETGRNSPPWPPRQPDPREVSANRSLRTVRQESPNLRGSNRLRGAREPEYACSRTRMLFSNLCVHCGVAKKKGMSSSSVTGNRTSFAQTRASRACSATELRQMPSHGFPRRRLALAARV